MPLVNTLLSRVSLSPRRNTNFASRTSLRKFANDKDYNNNDPVEEYSMAKSQVHTKIEGGNYPCKIIVETPDTKIVLYTDDHTVMNDWVQAFGKVKHLDEEVNVI